VSGEAHPWLLCPHTSGNGKRCNRKVLREAPARAGGAGRYYELDGIRRELAPGARLGEVTDDGQTVYCPRGHRASHHTL
jgi:hypothetical protein